MLQKQPRFRPQGIYCDPDRIRCHLDPAEFHAGSGHDVPTVAKACWPVLGDFSHRFSHLWGLMTGERFLADLNTGLSAKGVRRRHVFHPGANYGWRLRLRGFCAMFSPQPPPAALSYSVAATHHASPLSTAIRKTCGKWRYAVYTALFQTAVAWGMSTVVYQTGRIVFGML